jgi:hypothetical protein
VDNSTSVLQDTNPMTNGISTNAASQTDASQCYDTAGGENGANANGVMSCLNNDPTLLVGDSFASQVGVGVVELHKRPFIYLFIAPWYQIWSFHLLYANYFSKNFYFII